MAGFAHFLRGLLIPLFAALLLYLLATLLLLPFIRRHRTRYTAYLPLSTLPSPTSWRTTLSDALYALFAPSTWSRRHPPMHADDDASDFDDDEGEGLVGFEPVDQRRREVLERARGDERRVGRELEQGFRDESDDEEGADETRRELARPRG